MVSDAKGGNSRRIPWYQPSLTLLQLALHEPAIEARVILPKTLKDGIVGIESVNKCSLHDWRWTRRLGGKILDHLDAIKQTEGAVGQSKSLCFSLQPHILRDQPIDGVSTKGRQHQIVNVIVAASYRLSNDAFHLVRDSWWMRQFGILLQQLYAKCATVSVLVSRKIDEGGRMHAYLVGVFRNKANETDRGLCCRFNVGWRCRLKRNQNVCVNEEFHTLP